MELTMALPWQARRALSITTASVESIMSGTFTLRVTWAMKRSMSACSSRSGLARHASRTWAPPLTWARPISAPSSNFSLTMRSLKRREPITLVRSPTSTGRLSSVGYSASMPLTAAARVVAGQPGVRIHGDDTGRDLAERAKMIGHELRAGGAVESDGEEVEVLQGGIERIHPLPGQHGPHGLDGAADHERQRAPGLRESPLHADGRRLHVERVLAGLEEQRVDPALDQGSALAIVRVQDLIEGDAARDRDGSGPGSHRAQDEMGPIRSRVAVGCLASDAGGGQGYFVAAIGKPIFCKHIRRTAK